MALQTDSGGGEVSLRTESIEGHQSISLSNGRSYYIRAALIWPNGASLVASQLRGEVKLTGPRCDDQLVILPPGFKAWGQGLALMQLLPSYILRAAVRFVMSFAPLAWLLTLSASLTSQLHNPININSVFGSIS